MDNKQIDVKINEHIETLGNGINVIVSEIHKFNTDTVILADFSLPKKYETAIELGSGCGAIPLIWNKKNVPLSTIAVEIQKDACDMLNRSIKLNDLNEKIKVLNIDMKDITSEYFGKFDIVVCNPPYKKAGSGIKNDLEGKSIARHEKDININEICRIASKLLKFGGRFCVCQRPERLTDVITAFRNCNLEPKRMKFVQQRKDKPSKLFLLEGRKGGNPGGMVMLPTLFIENDVGQFSDDMKDIYGDFYKNKN